jgi:hypothetical protein
VWIAGGGDQLVASCEDALSDRPTQPSSASRDQPYLRHGIPPNNETNVFVYSHCAMVLSTKNETAIVVFTESL